MTISSNGPTFRQIYILWLDCYVTALFDIKADNFGPLLNLNQYDGQFAEICLGLDQIFYFLIFNAIFLKSTNFGFFLLKNYMIRKKSNPGRTYKL